MFNFKPKAYRTCQLVERTSQNSNRLLTKKPNHRPRSHTNLSIVTKKKCMPVLSILGKLSTQSGMLQNKCWRKFLCQKPLLQFYWFRDNWRYSGATFSVCKRFLPRLKFNSLLFNLYINDLPYSFKNTLSNPFVAYWYQIKLSCICRWFDYNITIKGRTAKRGLNALALYWRWSMLSINKKKVMTTFLFF